MPISNLFSKKKKDHKREEEELVRSSTTPAADAAEGSSGGGSNSSRGSISSSSSTTTTTISSNSGWSSGWMKSSSKPKGKKAEAAAAIDASLNGIPTENYRSLEEAYAKLAESEEVKEELSKIFRRLRIMVVGRSGSGKTTIIRLVMGEKGPGSMAVGTSARNGTTRTKTCRSCSTTATAWTCWERSGWTTSGSSWSRIRRITTTSAPR
jgi:ABC-type glutathione transport system ATPase component